MRHLTTLVLIILLVHITTTLTAQDPTFSQFYANRSYLNPAFQGMQKGFFFTVSERNQWLKIPRPYRTTSASVEMSPCYLPIALGFSFYRDREGEGLYISKGFNFTYSQVFVTSKNSNLHFGMRVGYTDKRINWLGLHFSDEIDPIYGFTTATGAIPIYDVINVFDMDFGSVYRFQTRSTYRKTKMKHAVGFSYNHAFEPIQSLYGTESVLPRRLTIHAGSQIPFASSRTFNYRTKEANKYWFVPNIKIERQWADSLATTQLYSWGFYVQTPLSVYGGLMVQHNNFFFRGDDGGLNASSLTLIAGFTTYLLDAPVTIGVSYDTHPFGLATGISGGSLELSLRFAVEDAKMICNPNGKARRWYQKSGRYIMDCNNFF